MKWKRTIGLVLVFCLLLPTALAAEERALPLAAGIEALRGQFESGCGPETGGYAIDYAYYSPVQKSETRKYPLVIWLHGMMQGDAPGSQVEGNEFAYWSSAEFQARFTGAGGAYLFVPRSHEEKYQYWNDSMLVPLKAAIDDFIASHRDTVDPTRVYIGGFSMGGKMTLKMAIAYPDFFAAAFPICPALFRPSHAQMDLLKELPLWFVASRYDMLAGYHSFTSYEWRYLTSNSARPEDCRLSVLGTVKYPDGREAGDNHFAWVAVTYDLFTLENGRYYEMETINGRGRPVPLSYPEGMIAWLSQFSSNSDGAPSCGSGSYRLRGPAGELVDMIRLLPSMLVTVVKVLLDQAGLISL